MLPFVLSISASFWLLVASVIAAVLGASAAVGVALLLGAAVAALAAAVIGRKIRRDP